jgi:ABC-type multidrug transport system ATPase subunit
MLEIRRLCVDYPQFSLGPISLRIAAGDFVSLIGPNGAGKSTLIRGLLGLTKLAQGTVLLGGDDLSKRSPETIARIGYLTDSSTDVLEEFTANEYWEYVRLARQRATGGEPQFMDEARRAAERLGLTALDQRLYSLSLGMRRKAQLAAVLAGGTDLLVLDEPFSGLDFLSSRVLEKMLLEKVAGSTAVLCSSHDLTIAARTSSRVLVLYGGQMLLNESIEGLGGLPNLEQAVVTALDGATPK